MPSRKTLERAAQDRREGKSASSQAGEFVREEIQHVREGKHGARSTKQLIAIGLAKARRAGVKVPPPGRGRGQQATRPSAKAVSPTGARGKHVVSAKRAAATLAALKREPRVAASKLALSKHAVLAARQRSGGQRSAAALKASRTKGPARRAAAATKAARTRRRRSDT